MGFDKQYIQWQRRQRNLGDTAVGRRDESVAEQGERIARHIDGWLGSRFFERGLDFGCGWGRFSEQLAQHCGHLWVADLFNDWVVRAAHTAVTTTPVILRSQKLPLDTSSMDLAIDIMTLQSIDDDALAREAMHELRRVTKPGARVVSLHIVKPRAPTRTGAQRAAHIGLSDWKESTLTDVDKAGDSYSLLTGTRI